MYGERVEHVFIVRVWLELHRHAPPRWRGSVEHLPTGQRRYFDALADLTEFIARQREQPPAPPGAACPDPGGG